MDGSVKKQSFPGIPDAEVALSMQGRTIESIFFLTVAS